MNGCRVLRSRRVTDDYRKAGTNRCRYNYKILSRTLREFKGCAIGAFCDELYMRISDDWDGWTDLRDYPVFYNEEE